MNSKILVVDDSMIVRKQITGVLTAAGYVVIEAGDGIDALGKLRTHADIRLVICDVTMPRMSGLEFLELMVHISSDVMAVMLTTDTQPEPMARAKELGAKGWLTKPMKQDQLLSLAHHLLGDDYAARATP